MGSRVRALVACVAFACAASALVRAAEPTAATVTDAEGKELKVTGLKFGIGARRLAFLAEGTDKGPLALEVREPLSTTYAKGVVTFVPLSTVEGVKYDYEKQLASIAVKGLKEPVAGTLQFKGINVLTFDAVADGKNAKYSGGAFTKGNIKAVAFAGAEPLSERKPGAPWAVQIDQPKAMDPTLKVSGVKFLYQGAGGTEWLSDTAPVRKGDVFKLDDTVTSFVPVAVDPNTLMAAVEVRTGDGPERIVVLNLSAEKDGKKGTLIGLLGESEAGWKLFPLHTIKVMKRAKKE